jgi:hypothetical protein
MSTKDIPQEKEKKNHGETPLKHVFGILSFEKETEYLLEDSKHDFLF